MSLPRGFAVRIGADVRRRNAGRTLIGGAPARVTYLSPAARALLDDDRLVVRDDASERLAEKLVETGVACPVSAALEQVWPEPAGTDQVSVVIPARDRAGALASTLAALSGVPRVLVVDDCSHDAGAIRAVAEEHGAELLRLERNLGPSGARNAGLARVGTPYVCFVDSDVRLTGEAVARLLRHFADPRVALVAPRILGLRESGGAIARYESLRSSLDRGPVSALVRPRSPVAWLPAAALVARVEALGAGFDQELRSGEDVDLVWRLADEGRLVRYDADVVARHDHLSETGSWARRKAFYGTSAAPLARRHGDHVAPAVLTPVSAAVLSVALVQRRWSFAPLAVVSALVTRRLARKLRTSDHPLALAGELVARSVLDSSTQLSSLLVRHWWPAAALAAPFSRRLRRALLVAAVVEAARAGRSAPAGDRLSVAALSRVDDLAYGVGVWWGALRERSACCLLPAVRLRG